MRWIRLLWALFTARFKSKIGASNTSTLDFRIWITDIDVSMANHAAIMTIMEAGRIDFMVRLNFFKIATQNKWYFPSQAMTVQFYRPLKIFQKAILKTRMSYVGEEWIYIEQTIERNGKMVATALTRGKIKDGRDTIPTSKIINRLKLKDVPEDRHALIDAYEDEISAMKSRFNAG